MSNLKITGKLQLSYEVTVSGNKNSALSCLAASLLLFYFGIKFGLKFIQMVL